MKRIAVGAICAVVTLCASARGAEYYAWEWLQAPHRIIEHPSYDLVLTSNNGAHAVALGEYGDNGYRYWTSVAAQLDSASHTKAVAYELSDGYPVGAPPYFYDILGAWDPTNPCVAANNEHKLWMGTYTTHNPTWAKCVVRTDVLTQQSPGDMHILSEDGHGNNDYSFTGECFGGTSDTFCLAYTDNYTDDGSAMWGLHYRRTYDAGENWLDEDGIPILPDATQDDSTTGPSLAVASRCTVYAIYRKPEHGDDPDSVVFEKTTDWGTENGWGNTPVLLGFGDQPCIAAVGKFVFACWRGEDQLIHRKYSTNAGENWSGDATMGNLGTYSHPNVSAVARGIAQGDPPGVLFVCQWTNKGSTVVLSRFGQFVGGSLIWGNNVALSPFPATGTQDFRPSVATMYKSDWSRSMGACVSNWNGSKKWVDLRYGKWQRFTYTPGGGGGITGTGRLIARDDDGSMRYATESRPHIVSGPADADLLPILVAPGSQPALALDGDGNRWVSYIRDDTVWTMTSDGSYEVTFAGSSSAVPGQPSIVCYPSGGGGITAGAVTFAVYDTAGGTSMVMFARVDTGGVVLDTIESVANLGDSLPCINIYKSDTLLVTWQHGDSTLSSMLADYGPSTGGQPPAWTSPSLVTATGYHPMSVMENGSVLNCAWTQKSGSNYSIQRASCDLASAMFGSWTPMATPGGSSSAEKANSVYAGAGVSVWQQKDANGKWTIKGFVRGAETTLVANDTDAYGPHAVAESSAISPSIDQVRVHLLYTAGVAFEVDSGVYDTGETRYVCESLNVSHAGSDATKYNNGAKLVRKNGSDSLFAVYSDADGAVAFAWSAAGDSWRREIMTTGRNSPTIAEDSTGKRWVVVTKPVSGMVSSAVEAYYRSGASWIGPQTLYTNAVVTIGPASLAGASSTTSSIAYAAFLNTSGMTKSVILAKFNGTSVSTYTVASGSSLGNPTLTVEPYKSDSDRIHVAWEDNGTIKYRMDTDGRSTSIASNWTSTYDLTGMGIVAHHPSINSDHDQIVVAWAQGTPADVYSRKRLTTSAYNNWDAAVDLSNTAQDASDYPTIAMGDTVVVAWQELRIGGSDFDILASIDFGDTLNIADNATFSTYPQILFQNKTSGDTTIPYLHTVWSECPPANYFEVGYNKLNLKHPDGEGQQTASSTPIPVKPLLASCSPNPFRNHTQISYALPSAGNVSLRVYDVTGRTVRTLASGSQKAGSYTVSWDARDSRGKQVPYGVYFYRLDTPGFRSVKKAVVTR